MRAKLITVLVLATLFGWQTGLSQNNALSFDGTDDQVTVSGLSINAFTGVTFEAWVYPRSFNPQSVDDYISNIVAEATTGALLRIGDNDPSELQANNVAQFVVITSTGLKKCNGTTQLTANMWHHLAGTYDGSSVKLYVNGVLENTVAHTGTLSTASSEIWLGGSVTARFLDGLLDEVRIWNDARSESEIRKNMHRELPDPAGENNLVAYYKLNSTTGTTATDTKGSYNGTLTNMSGNEWETSSALFGPKNLLDFDGTNDYVNINNLHVSGSTITVEAWVYLREFGHQTLDANIANLLKGGDENIVLRIGDGGQPNNMPQWVVKINNDHKRLNANARIALNTWYHLAGVYDGQEMKLYINGKLDISQSQTGTLTTTVNSFGLGGIDRYLNGQMDEIRIWNDARTAEEIRENMCKTLTGNEENLVAYYSCDNSKGTTLPDLTGNGNNGTLTNMDGNSDWVASSAFNTWLNTTSSSWSTTSNWSLGTKPTTESVGIESYPGGAAPVFTTGDEAGAGNLVVNTDADWLLGGYLGVSGNLILLSDVNLNGQTVQLGATANLIEEQGRFYGTTGQITTTRSLSAISAENVGGLGATITTSANMGSTTLTRTHQAASSPVSIKRRYTITPTNNSGLNATLTFNYYPGELNTLDESTLHLLRSTDGGTNWTNMGGTVNGNANTITLSSIGSFSDWTAGGDAAPILETSNPSHSYFAGDTPITIAPDLSITYSGNITAATVSISPVVNGDVLSVNGLPAGLSSEWNSGSKILTISGTSNATDYQAALRLVKFETTSASTDTRTVDFNLGDGVGLTLNGQKHFYEVVENGSHIHWTDARTASLNKTYSGASGYLATITSETEGNYIADKVSKNTWIGASDNAVQGIWKWMDGPEAGIQFWQRQSTGTTVNGCYENWGDGEPNNAYSTGHSPTYEDFAHIWGNENPNNPNIGKWNDYWNDESSVTNYLVEYGGDGTLFTTMDDATISVQTELTWDGSESTDWATTANWSQDVLPNSSLNLIIGDQVNQPVITSGVDATCNNLTVNSGATLTVESGGSLITNGTITNNGTINIEADYFFNTWNFLSSPVENALAGTFEGHFLQSWNEPTASWTEITATSQSLTPAKGYALYLSSGLKPPGMTLTYSGTPNTGNQSIALSYTNNGSGTKGANLVGNPYPSYLDWDVVTGYGSKYTWDGSAYNAYTAQGGFGTGSRYASPLEGFFVVTGSATTFTLNNTMRTHNSGNKASQGTSFQHGVVVAASNGNYSDALWVVFDQDASENFELERDAWKLLSPTNGISQMWSVSPDGPLAVDVRQETESIPLGFSNTLPGAYSITLQQMVGVTALFLEDTQTGTIHNFANGDYHFNYTLTDNPNRFKLLFGAIGTPETANATIRQWINGQTLYISAPTLAGQQVQVTVYSLTGQALQRQQVTLGEINAIALQGKQGAVVVETKSEDGSRVLTTKGMIIK